MILSLVLSGAAVVVSFLLDGMGRLMKDSGATGSEPETCAKADRS
jgi:hypothetical protein